MAEDTPERATVNEQRCAELIATAVATEAMVVLPPDVERFSFFALVEYTADEIRVANESLARMGNRIRVMPGRLVNIRLSP